MNDFVGWLNEELDRRGWSQSELARRGGVSPSLINQVMNGHTRPGNKLAQGLSRAFKMPEEEIMRRVGILPSKPRIKYRVGNYSMTERMVELFEKLDADEQELVVLLLEKMTGNEPRIIGDPPEDDGV